MITEIKIWVDDIRPAPYGYFHARSVEEAKALIWAFEAGYGPAFIKEINLDHDAGDFAIDGGDYIEILNWLESRHTHSYPIALHSMNPVGVENMRRIIQRNGWKEV